MPIFSRSTEQLEGAAMSRAMSTGEPAKDFAERMTSDFYSFRHLLLTLSPDEMRRLEAHMDRLRQSTLGACEKSFQEVFPPEILGQGHYAVQIRVGRALSTSPDLGYRNFVPSVHHRMVLMLPEIKLGELVALFQSFMTPNEATEFALTQGVKNPLVLAPKSNAYGVMFIRSLQPLPKL